MTAESAITDRVAEMHAAMAKEPPNDYSARTQPAQVLGALDHLGT
jgi:hypothetical protein